jgi:uncharacterized protein YdaU (DUF1376 family)
MTTMPKMNLWIDAFNSDTCFLTNDELGIYFRLIFYAWSKEGYLPDDKEFIQTLCRDAHNPNNEKIDKILKLYWTYDGSDWNKGWYQKRLREEYIRAVNTNNQNKLNGSRGGQVTAQRTLSERSSESVASISISKSTSISNNKYKDEVIIFNYFNEFWELVTNKVSKGQALKNYKKVDKDWLAKPKELAEMYNQHYNSLTDKTFAKQPAFWLSAEKYLDETPKELSIANKENSEFESWVNAFKNPTNFSKQYAKKNKGFVEKMVEKGMITEEDVKNLYL